MGQHLYECERCHKYGIAHYILEAGALVLLCTACFKAHRQRKQVTA